MSELARIQAAFQRAILTGDRAVLGDLLGGPDASPEERLDVYRTSHRTRLQALMTARHATLGQHLGGAGFEALATVYIAAHGAEAPDLRSACAALPRFLHTRPALADLAALGEAFADALQAADPPFGEHDPMRPERGWSRATVVPVPSARRLPLSSNAFAIWTALREGRTAPPEVPAAEVVLVWRRGAVCARALSLAEARLWDQAVAEGVRPQHGPEVLASLTRWRADGLAGSVAFAS